VTVTYCLGVDLGTTYAAAAVWRQGVASPVQLGHTTSVVPSVAFLGTDGELLVGEAAERRALGDPAGIAREFKRRMGDPVPIVLRSTEFSAEELTARLLQWIVERVVELEGQEWPKALVVTHPANWHDHRIGTLQRAIELANLRDVLLLSEPEAAAVYYSAQERIGAADRVVVYDLGGGTFDVAVLQHTPAGTYDVLGTPQGIDHLGGADFDQLLFTHVAAAAGLDLAQLAPHLAAHLDRHDLRLARQLAALRQDCVDAKIDLSANTATNVLVSVGDVDTEVRVTRHEFERLIHGPVASTIEAVDRALESAEIEPADVHAVLLVGGSSLVPHVARAVSTSLGRPIAIDTHSKQAVSLGAAAWAAQQVGLTRADVNRLHRRAGAPRPAARASLRRSDVTGPRSEARPVPASGESSLRRPGRPSPTPAAREERPRRSTREEEPERPATTPPSTPSDVPLEFAPARATRVPARQPAAPEKPAVEVPQSISPAPSSPPPAPTGRSAEHAVRVDRWARTGMVAPVGTGLRRKPSAVRTRRPAAQVPVPGFEPSPRTRSPRPAFRAARGTRRLVLVVALVLVLVLAAGFLALTVLS
jgi:actin-like ATPase involved in cell morphogenesis